MSDLFRAKIAKIPLMPAELMPLDEEAEEDQHEFENGDHQDLPQSQTSDDSSSASSTATIKAFAQPEQFVLKPLESCRPGLLTKSRKQKKPDTQPISWNHYFSQKLALKSSLDSAFVTVGYYTPASENGPLFVCHHGAGSSALTFALMASEIRKLHPAAGVFCFDARGHGETITPDDQDLSLKTLSNDLGNTIFLLRDHLGWSKLPEIILVGHSVGGPVVTDLVKRCTLGSCVLGYVVIDVAEGSALGALEKMKAHVQARPSSFSNLSQAIDWHVRSRTIKNKLSARVSIPPLVYDSGEKDTPKPWKWRTDLSIAPTFWEDWFTGLSKKFLEGQGGKLLILAGTDRLDKELTIGQMQGKYQLVVLPEVGHFVQEDAPEKTASIVCITVLNSAFYINTMLIVDRLLNFTREMIVAPLFYQRKLVSHNSKYNDEFVFMTNPYVTTSGDRCLFVYIAVPGLTGS